MTSKLRRLPAPVHMIYTNFERLACDWFHANYHTRENGAKLVPVDHSTGTDCKTFNVRAKVPPTPNGRGGEVTVGRFSLYSNSGRVELKIEAEYGYLFDDVEAIYRKMEA